MIENITIKGVLNDVHLPIIEVKVQNMHLHFILDTGSTNSILDKRVIIPLEDHISYVGKYELQGIEGNAIQSLQGVLSFVCCGKAYQQTFCFMSLQKPFEVIKRDSGIEVHGILGTDFLMANKWIIDFKEGIIRID